MTNVPQPIRDIWTELYKLFDKHYLMPDNQPAWRAFWEDAQKLWLQSGKNKLVLGAIELVAECITQRAGSDFSPKNALVEGESR